MGSSFELVEARVPEGAVPPGPAVAAVVDGPIGFSSFRERFTMPPRGGATVRLWFQWRGGVDDHTAVVVEVQGRGGATHRQRLPLATLRDRTQSPTSALFLGDAEGLGTFVDEVRQRTPAPSEADASLSDIRLDQVAPAVARGCRSLARAAVIIADRPSTATPALVRCAALGARVVIVDSTPRAPLAGLPAGRAVPWGAGLLAWAPTVALAAPPALDAFGDSPTGPRNFAGRVASHVAYQGLGDREQPRSVSQLLVLALIGGYVLVLGPLGWFVLRRRNTLLSWAYFPAVAVAATVLLGVATLGTDERADRLQIDRTVLSSPDGTGLEVVGLRVLGVQTRAYRIHAPYRDADLVQMGRPFRFGSPFTKPAGEVELVHDATRATVDVSGLAVSRWSEAGVSWAAPRTVAVPRLERTADGGLVLVAASDAPTRTALVATSEGWALAQHLAPGERRRVTLDAEGGRLGERLQKLGGRWLAWTDLGVWEEMAPSSAAVIVTEPSGRADPAFRVSPRLPIEERNQRIVVGVAP